MKELSVEAMDDLKRITADFFDKKGNYYKHTARPFVSCLSDHINILERSEELSSLGQEQLTRIKEMRKKLREEKRLSNL